MKEFDVPVLPLETPLRSALATLRFAERGGVATLEGEKLFLISSGAILRGIAEEKATLSEITKRKAVAVMEPLHSARNWKVTDAICTPPRGYVGLGEDAAAEAVFNGTHHSVHVHRAAVYDFALKALGPGRAVIVSRHEQDSDGFVTAPTDCYCKQDEDHVTQVAPKKCLMCGGELDCR